VGNCCFRFSGKTASRLKKNVPEKETRELGIKLTANSNKGG